MKYIVIDSPAIDELVSNRFLQSNEFAPGAALTTVLKGLSSAVNLSSSISINSIGDGTFITGHLLQPDSRYLVIDVEQSQVFADLSDSDILVAFQKTLRFIKKFNENLSLTFAERLITGTTKAVLFPFRYKTTPFRIVIEREPWPERLQKRGHAQKFFLLYKAGYEGGDAAREAGELTNFRKAYESLSALRDKLKKEHKSELLVDPKVDQLKVTQLGHSPYTSSTIFRGYEEWRQLITDQQRNFIESPIVGPHRIEGAAGTGKTLSLMLKAIFALYSSDAESKPFHAVFITHSDATKRTINEVFSVIGGGKFISLDRNLHSNSLKVCTLSELCAEQLRQSISETEFIDRDAMESKGLQVLYISEAFKELMREDFSSHERFISPELSTFLKEEEEWKICIMLQHEISVIIKGRAAELLDQYKKIPPLKYGLPINSIADKGFIFAIFKKYQEKLGVAGQFDTDDVVLTAIGQLDTPIWRRRRNREGFDAVFIDETHLFNINELHLFHYFSRTEGPYPIVYSVDLAQAVGDHGWTVSDLSAALIKHGGNQEGTTLEARVNTIFRSAPGIVNLAFSIVSSGATLFTNFENPLDKAASGFTDAEERLAREPAYINVPNDDFMVQHAFARAEALQQEMGCRRSDILIVSLDSDLVKKLGQYAREKNKPAMVLKRRGDSHAVESARQSGQNIVGHADYVGGLEFFAVIIVGVDGGRVPPTGTGAHDNSKNFLSYASHNRLYVAVSRAKYRVEMIGEKARGPSKLIESAIQSSLIQVSDAEVN